MRFPSLMKPESLPLLAGSVTVLSYGLVIPREMFVLSEHRLENRLCLTLRIAYAFIAARPAR